MSFFSKLAKEFTRWTLRVRLQKIAGSVSLAAAVLAIASVDSIWLDKRDLSRRESHELVQLAPEIWRPRRPNPEAALAPVTKPKTRILAAAEKPAVKPLQSEISQSFEQDELQDRNPFAHLSSTEPLQNLLRKGVVKFKRETYRSPVYREESGYDIISYEVEHPDHSKSSILAYLEKAEGEDTGKAGADGRLPFVVFMVSKGNSTDFSFYRGGSLIEQSELTREEAQAFVSHRLRDGIPFLSVAR